MREKVSLSEGWVEGPFKETRAKSPGSPNEQASKPNLSRPVETQRRLSLEIYLSTNLAKATLHGLPLVNRIIAHDARGAHHFAVHPALTEPT